MSQPFAVFSVAETVRVSADSFSMRQPRPRHSTSGDASVWYCRTVAYMSIEPRCRVHRHSDVAERCYHLCNGAFNYLVHPGVDVPRANALLRINGQVVLSGKTVYPYLKLSDDLAVNDAMLNEGGVSAYNPVSLDGNMFPPLPPQDPSRGHAITDSVSVSLHPADAPNTLRYPASTPRPDARANAPAAPAPPDADDAPAPPAPPSPSPTGHTPCDRCWHAQFSSSLRNKRPDLSGWPPCKGVAIGVARREARRSGERTLRAPPS